MRTAWASGAAGGHSREWFLAPPHPARDRLAAEAGISPVVAQLLANRGLCTADDARAFLRPDFKRLHPPEKLPNAAEAARRLIAAARDRRKIVIYGDYDVDGVTATAILWHALTLAGADVDYYIPSRLEEGYGLNADALEAIVAGGGWLVITVDCGITACEEARRARELGLELIITDHHQPRQNADGRPPNAAHALRPALAEGAGAAARGFLLPDADCVVHPTACGVSSPNPDLSGAGVALKIAWALAQGLCGTARVDARFRDFLVEATALAALGLVADVVPLTGENRIIASFGLRHLSRTRNPGLRALIEVSGLDGRQRLDDYDVGFALAPRLNAVGRLGHAREAVELFTRATPAQAREIAARLDAHNRERQAMEREIFAQAERMVFERGFHRDGCRAIVLASDKWHAGVIGIVAARIVERFGRPTVLIALNGASGESGMQNAETAPAAQGSGRSVRHFPLHEALAACAEHLVSHGGHAMAAGVRIRPEQIEPFTCAFQAEAAHRLTAADLKPRLHLDDELHLADLTIEVVEAIEQMAPFGTSNPRPLLCTGPLELVDTPRVVGKSGQHLQFAVRQRGVCEASAGGDAGATFRKVVAFNRAGWADAIMQARQFRLAFEPIINEWNGQRKLELKAVDWKP
jgi:single-stranded-DNA-specific exonuclease